MYIEKTHKVTQKLHATFQHMQPIDFIGYFFYVSIEGRLIGRVQLFEDLFLKAQKRRRKGGKK